jgi:hypothetical protein
MTTKLTKAEELTLEAAQQILVDHEYIPTAVQVMGAIRSLSKDTPDWWECSEHQEEMLNFIQKPKSVYRREGAPFKELLEHFTRLWGKDVAKKEFSLLMSKHKLELYDGFITVVG